MYEGGGRGGMERWERGGSRGMGSMCECVKQHNGGRYCAVGRCVCVDESV